MKIIILEQGILLLCNMCNMVSQQYQIYIDKLPMLCPRCASILLKKNLSLKEYVTEINVINGYILSPLFILYVLVISYFDNIILSIILIMAGYFATIMIMKINEGSIPFDQMINIVDDIVTKRNKIGDELEDLIIRNKEHLLSLLRFG